MLRASKPYGRNCAVSDLWCQEKRLQDIVVRLRGGVTGELRLVKDRPIETAGGGVERLGNRQGTACVLRIEGAAARSLRR